MSHSREISSNPSVFKEKIEKGATSKFSLFNRIFFSRFSWNDKLSFTMFLWLQRRNNQDRFLCRLTWNNVLLFTCEKCRNPTVDRLCMTNQTHDCQRHVGGEEGNRWKEETRKQGISPGDEVGWELIAAGTREERENLTIKKREVGTDWCLFFSWEGNSHRGLGSHGNSSLGECVCGDVCVCVDGL